MAKWGEGDPRWIVQEREDGTNLNDWHWFESRTCLKFALVVLQKVWRLF